MGGTASNSIKPNRFDAVFAAHAVQVRRGYLDPVYWYISDEPGPFYVNTENFLGADKAECLLRFISETLIGGDSSRIFEQIWGHIMDLYMVTPCYREVVRALLTILEKSPHSVDLVSGGERRDWLFSVPLAHELQVPHVWLRKNHDSYIMMPDRTSVTAGQLKRQGLVHVADILNRGISFREYWLPGLQLVGLRPELALSVIDRSTEESNVLRDEELPWASLYTIDVAFFQEAASSGLITRFALDECILYLVSADQWMSEVFFENFPYNVSFPVGDVKNAERARRFFRKLGIDYDWNRTCRGLS